MSQNHLDSNIAYLSAQLSEHPLYAELSDLESLRIFMEYHSFAVYDFMCLLKSLQRHMTFRTEPWRPSPYPDEVVRFINEIVLCEESDLDHQQKPCSHFNMYLRAMNEVRANSGPVLSFVRSIRHMDYRVDELRPGIKEFVDYNLHLSLYGEVEEVAGAFLFGREKLVPTMFTSIVRILKSQPIASPAFLHYLERHIQVDGDEHGPMAEKCLEAICDRNKLSLAKANKVAIRSLELRKELWDACLEAILLQRENARPQI